MGIAAVDPCCVIAKICVDQIASRLRCTALEANLVAGPMWPQIQSIDVPLPISSQFCQAKLELRPIVEAHSVPEQKVQLITEVFVDRPDRRFV